MERIVSKPFPKICPSTSCPHHHPLASLADEADMKFHRGTFTTSGMQIIEADR
jgi:hypothetical protein